MKISWIKQEKDNENFKVAERLGMEVHRLNNPEEVDKILIEGTKKAQEVAKQTMKKVKQAMKLDYFEK